MANPASCESHARQSAKQRAVPEGMPSATKGAIRITISIPLLQAIFLPSPYLPACYFHCFHSC
jgi:hypothetical protein